MTRGDLLGKYNLVVTHIKLWKSLSQQSRLRVVLNLSGLDTRQISTKVPTEVTCGGAYKIMHVKRDAYIFQCIIGHEVTIIIAKNDNIIRLF